MLAIFSLDDLLIAYKADAGGKVNDLASFGTGLVTPFGTYFLHIDDIKAYRNFAGSLEGDMDNFEAMQNEYAEEYLIDQYAQPDVATGRLSQFLMEKNTGMTLMEYQKSTETFKFVEYNGVSVSIRGCDD